MKKGVTLVSSLSIAAAAVLWTLPASASAFTETCTAQNADAKMGAAAVEVYCSCLETEAAKSGDANLEATLLEIMSKPRKERRAATDAAPEAKAVVQTCVKQLHGKG